MNQLSGHFTIRRLLAYCAAPVAMMVFTSIYGIVDGFFVSNWAGQTAFAAVNLIMPALMILTGLGFMFGTGGTALVARTLGEGKEKLASEYFSMITWTAAILGAIIGIIGFILAPDIARMLGADSSMMNDCVTYARLVLIFNATYMLQNLFQSFLAAAGRPGLGFVITVTGGITNMILDWLFVGIFHWGTAGAAIATGIGTVIGSLWPMIWFMTSGSTPLHLIVIRFSIRPILQSCLNGLSELMSNISSSLVAILFNFQLMCYAGQQGVAAYGVVMYLSFFFTAVFFGYTVGASPVISYHFGAGDRKELHSLFGKSLVITLTAGLIMMGAAEVLAEPLSSLFVGCDASLEAMTIHAMRIFATCIAFAGFNIFTSALFTALNNGVISAAMAFLRSLVFQAACVIILPQFFAVAGIWWSMTVVEVLAMIVNLVILAKEQKRYGY
ncbi:MATE family efflux transporter [uncultured Faecalibaculum sp.]|uniref:MATE family efflux transporter n=1 Tax=uncultured Faecalibaculum sp. TaxID=1729681 RepID=UPI002614630A|nr:MATE family efflux transporter [uncultured Faecalibaculum sp.]